MNHVGSRDVDERIKSGDPGPSLVAHVQRRHVALVERDVWIQAARAFNKLSLQVYAAYLNPVRVQVTSHMTGAATHVTGWANVTYVCRKTLKELAVKRLVPQLIGDASDILVRDKIVAGLGIHGKLPTDCSRCHSFTSDQSWL
jgi:hypothetical protein